MAGPGSPHNHSPGHPLPQPGNPLAPGTYQRAETWARALWLPRPSCCNAVSTCDLCSVGIAPGEWGFVLVEHNGDPRNHGPPVGRCHGACGVARLRGLGAPQMLPPPPNGFPAEFAPAWPQLAGNELTHDAFGQPLPFMLWPSRCPRTEVPPHPDVLVRFWPVQGAAADGLRTERADRSTDPGNAGLSQREQHLAEQIPR